MALNYPGPYEVRINYVVASRPHQQRLNVRIDGTPVAGVDDFTTIDALRRDDAPFALDAEVDAWVDLIKVFLPSAGGDIVNAELWKYTPDSFDADFVAAYDISVAGTNGSANTPASQLIWTFRTQEGGIMKVILMDVSTTPGLPVTPPYTGSTLALANAIVNGTSPWLARDTSYAIANIAMYPGQNEALFKKIYRP
jgi:hypothetical protein